MGLEQCSDPNIGIQANTVEALSTAEDKRATSPFPELKKLLFPPPTGSSSAENDTVSKSKVVRRMRTWGELLPRAQPRGLGYVARVREIQLARLAEADPECLPPSQDATFDLIQLEDGLLKAVPKKSDYGSDSAAAEDNANVDLVNQSEVCARKKRKRPAAPKRLTEKDLFADSPGDYLSKHQYILSALSPYSIKRARFPRDIWTCETYRNSNTPDISKILQYQEQLNVVLKYEFFILERIVENMPGSRNRQCSPSQELQPDYSWTYAQRSWEVTGYQLGLSDTESERLSNVVFPDNDWNCGHIFSSDLPQSGNSAVPGTYSDAQSWSCIGDSPACLDNEFPNIAQEGMMSVPSSQAAVLFSTPEASPAAPCDLSAILAEVLDGSYSMACLQSDYVEHYSETAPDDSHGLDFYETGIVSDFDIDCFLSDMESWGEDWSPVFTDNFTDSISAEMC